MFARTHVLSSVFVLALALVLAPALSHADSFDIIRDGQTYRCESVGTTNPGGAVRCADLAYAGPFSRDEALSLCQGAINEGPAVCAKQAYAGPLSKSESLDLCRGATSSGPADCQAKAYAGPFSKPESIQLCSRNGSAATADCAIRAYAGPYTREQAINLCRTGQPALLSSVLAKVLGTTDVSVALEKALAKRDRENAN